MLVCAPEMECGVDYVNSATGIKPPLSADKMCELLTKMQLTATVKPGGETLVVSVPPTRADVLHACDVMEDVAIAYGFDNIEKTVPNTKTIGIANPQYANRTRTGWLEPKRHWAFDNKYVASETTNVNCGCNEFALCFD